MTIGDNAWSAWLARHPSWAGRLAALLSAALLVLAFPTTELGPLALVALVPMLLAMRTRGRWQRFRLGWLVGFLVELALFRWIPFTMTEMTSIAGPLTWLMCAGYALWHGLRLGVFLMLAEPLRRAVETRRMALAPLAVALLYMVVEWSWPVIFPWALGHAAWELPVASALLALQGVPLLTLTVVLINAAIAEAWARRSQRHVPVGALLALVIVAVTALALAPGPSGETLRVAIVQPNYTLAEKKKASIATRQVLLARFEAQLRALPRDTFDLVIASEGAFPMWWRLDADSPSAPKNQQLDATRQVQRAIAEGPRAHAIIGGLRQDEARRTRNSAVHIGPDGTLRGHYDKQTLVPFSEYVPLADVFPVLAEIRGIGNVLAGESPCAFDVAPISGQRADPVRVACGICYESMFADRTRADAGDAQLLVNLTIDTWFGRSTAPRMHLMTQASRAAELGVPLLRSALTGISAHLDLHGQVVQALPSDAPGVLDATVSLSRDRTIFRAVGQLLAPLGALACALALLDALLRRKSLGGPP